MLMGHDHTYIGGGVNTKKYIGAEKYIDDTFFCPYGRLVNLTSHHITRGNKMSTKTTSKPVIVRTYSAGAHFGYLVSRDGKEVTLERARRLWRWFGAWTLSEIATSGLDVTKSKIGCPVSITLTEAIEIIDCTADAVAIIETAKWSE